MLPDLLHLGVVVLIIAAIFAVLATLLYGYRVPQVSTLSKAMAVIMTYLTAADDGWVGEGGVERMGGWGRGQDVRGGEGRGSA